MQRLVLPLEEIYSIVGRDRVISEKGLVQKYSQDFSPFPSIEPGVVVSPSSVRQISEIMRLANQNNFHVFARGNGASFTGLMNPTPGRSIILETTRLNKIVQINEQDKTVTAECGIVLDKLERAVERKGFYIHTVTVPIRFSTLGGILSGVVGGGLPIRGASAGTDCQYLLGLEVVLPSGRVMNAGARGSNVRMQGDFLRGGNGPDLAALFVGDAGYLGIKTKATLQIYPNRPFISAGCWNFRTLKESWSALRKLETFDPLPYTQIKVRDGEEFSLTFVCESQSRHELESNVKVIDTVCLGSRGKEGSNEQKQLARNHLNFMRDDKRVTSPIGMVAFLTANSNFIRSYTAVKQLIDRRINKKNLREDGVFYTSTFRPNTYNSIYVNIGLTYDRERTRGKIEVLKLLREAYALAVELGCAPEPHQGFGARVMAESWSREYRNTISELKAAFDPKSVLNPGVWG